MKEFGLGVLALYGAVIPLVWKHSGTPNLIRS